MKFRTILLAAATAGAFPFFVACGGGSDSGGNIQSPVEPTTQPQPSQASNQSQQPAGNEGQSSKSPAQYVAIDLTPDPNGTNGTEALGIGDGEQVGQSPLGHALLWRGSASSVVDLNFSKFVPCGAVATSGGVQVGWCHVNEFDVHAFRWSGSASSAVDLHPSGFHRSMAQGISGDQIVGEGLTTDGFHALLWTSHGIVDLRPSGFDYATAVATDGAQQVGSGRHSGARTVHALLWTGSANSVVELHPDEYCLSQALGVDAGQQVGFGGCGESQTSADWRRALLWKGSAQSVVSLHPSGFRDSAAVAVAAGWQAGWGTVASGLTHALVWNGTADSAVDLHVFLPAGFVHSQASGIDASGNVVGGADGHAILWVRQ